MNKLLYTILFILFFAQSCVKEDIYMYNQEPGTPVTSSISLNITDNIPGTKAIVDPNITEETSSVDVIKNIWVIQYNGITDDALLVGEPKYYEYNNSFDGQIKLVASSSENSVVVIANTFNPVMTFAQNSTLGELKSRWYNITDENSLFAKDGNDKYIIFSAIDQKIISEGSHLEFQLKRNIARINIEIKNSSTDVTITDWQMKQVPAISHYVNSYELSQYHPQTGNYSIIDYPVVKPNTLLTPKTSDSDVAKETSFVTYLPVNKRGVAENCTNEAYKNYYAPINATYFQINGTFQQDGATVPISFLFYLGKDMEKDFNILPNHSYSYTFEIKSRGNAEMDYRIKEWGLVNFANSNDELANCYIINPATINGYNRKFRIPVKIVDEFWGNNGYEDVPNNVLGSSIEWYVKIIACNFDNTKGQLSFTQENKDMYRGKGSYDANTFEPTYFEFSVEPGTEGNAIVAIYRSNAGAETILWSWHLWITNYDPTEAFRKNPIENVFEYSVPGGNVHRYDNGIWNKEYARRFIMDRNLGANSTTATGSGKGSLYYQFGRKDPFFGQGTPDFNKFSVTNYNNIDEDIDKAGSIRYSIYNPLVYIKNPSGQHYWNKGSKYNPAPYDGTMLWQDPKTSTKTHGSLAATKSIFDPCPPGYCVPKTGTWEDFYEQTASKPTTNINMQDKMIRNFISWAESRGAYYWPYPESGLIDNVPSNAVFYPCTGFKNDINIGGADYIYAHAANPYSESYSYNITIYSNDIQQQRTLGRAWGIPVRCITSRDSQIR